MNKKPVRILHVIGSMNRGGAETMIMNFYRTINREQVQFDFVENTFESAAFDQEILALGGRIFRCPHYNGKNHFLYVKWWKHFFQEHAVDYAAVHGHLGSTAAIYLSVAKKMGIYTIAHSHNTGRFTIRGLLYQLYAYPTRFVADFFFGCSLDAGISRYGRKVCATDKFTVLNNAIDTEHYAFDVKKREEIRSLLGVCDKTVIGHVGRFEEQKNHRFLVQIFEQIHRENPETALLLVGDGKLRCEIEDQVREAGLIDSVIFTGVQNDTSVFYQAVDVFVFPSLYEGKPFAIIEAQVSGLPCVISDKVPTECVITKNLVTVRNLKESADLWAEHILLQTKCERKDHSHEVKSCGYDIFETVKWLEDFYLRVDEYRNGR